MTVRETSAESHALNMHDTKKHRVRVFVRQHGPVTRRQIAVALGEDTATISGLVTPLVRHGFLYETEKGPCPVTGRTAIFLESPAEQLRMF